VQIFVNHRREDASGHALLLAEALVSQYGRDNAFIDVDAIRLGLPFDAAPSSCDILIALIGRGWLDSAGPECMRPARTHPGAARTAGDARPR
jgi:hypothetical protein